MTGCKDCVEVLRAGIKNLCHLHELEAENAKMLACIKVQQDALKLLEETSQSTITEMANKIHELRLRLAMKHKTPASDTSRSITPEKTPEPRGGAPLYNPRKKP